MTGITREKASQVAASFLGGQSRYLGTYYKTYAATDTQGREWKFTFDGSILAEKKEHGERVSTDATYKTEMVSPICTYEDIPTIQELVRQLRHKGAFSNTSCGIHIHVEAAAFNARTLRNLVNIFYSKEDLLFSALQVRESRWGYCKPMDERFLQELNRKRPQTMRAFQKIWYGGEDGSNTHYHDSRYHALNLHSVFSHGTVEFRLFNSTVEHAGKIKADIQLCLAICAQALNQRAASHTKTQTTNPAYTFRTWLLRLGMIGDEFATARKHLLENLEGNLAWRDPAQAERQRERMRQAALERLPQPEEYPQDIPDDLPVEPDEEQDEDQSLGSRTVQSGSVSKGKDSGSQSLQMIERPLMTPDELKSMPKGQFIVMKTGAYPMKVKLKLFFQWGISFGEPYTVPDKGNRPVAYAGKKELAKAIREKFPPPPRKKEKPPESKGIPPAQFDPRENFPQPSQQSQPDAKVHASAPTRRKTPPGKEREDDRP